jgi:hypothetical protein
VLDKDILGLVSLDRVKLVRFECVKVGLGHDRVV